MVISLIVVFFRWYNCLSVWFYFLALIGSSCVSVLCQLFPVYSSIYVHTVFLCIVTRALLFFKLIRTKGYYLSRFTNRARVSFHG